MYNAVCVMSVCLHVTAEGNDEEERTLGHEIITRGRQAYKVLHEGKNVLI